MAQYWISKYALSQGIFAVDAEERGDNMLVVKTNGPHSYNQYFHGEARDWHRTELAATNKAEAMRMAKIHSLKKSIAKLEKLKFGATNSTAR